MQNDVIFAILLNLLTKRSISREEIAERYELSKRTVTRYLGVLADSGVPIVSKPGKGGGVSIADDYVIDKTFFTDAEIKRLNEVLSRASGDYDDKLIKKITDKLAAVNAAKPDDEFVIRREDLLIDGGASQSTAVKGQITVLSRAITECRSVDVKYTDANRFSTYRTIDPYTVIFKDGSWYLYGYCRLRHDFRLFKIARMRDLRLTSKKFARLSTNAYEKLEEEFYDEVIVDFEVEFTSSALSSVSEWLGEEAVTERGTFFRAAATLPSNSKLLSKLLSFGSSIKVIKPASLAAELKAEAERMLNFYK